MRTTLALRFPLCIALSVGFAGCDNPAQIYWHHQIGFAVDGIGEIQRAGASRLNEGQLHAIMGEPDFRYSVLAFSEALAKQARHYTMATIWEEYYRDLGAEAKSAVWTNDESFLRCRVWVYDERKHYRSPLYGPFGYHVYYFVLRGTEVVSSGAVVRAETTVPGVQAASR